MRLMEMENNTWNHVLYLKKKNGAWESSLDLEGRGRMF